MKVPMQKWIGIPLLVFGLWGLVACGGSSNNNDGTALIPPPGDNNPPPGNNNPPPAGTTLAAVNDSYAWLGNSRIAVPAANGVLANDTLATGAVAFQGASTQGGTVAIAADGGFTYEPPAPTAAGAFTGPDTFTYTATDAGGATATGTVTITVEGVARFVKNDFVGTSNGSSTAPFTTLAAATAVAGPGDTIFVFSGNPGLAHDGPITLLANQKLIGQGAGLTFDVLPANPDNSLLPIDGVVSTTALPATPPVLTRTAAFVGNAPILTLANNVEVAGFIIDGTTTGSNLLGMSGVPIGFNIHDNTIRNLPKAAIQLLGATGGTGMIVNNTLENILGGNPDNAIDIVTTAAGVDFTLTGNTLNNVLESGIRVQFGSGAVVVNNNTLSNVGTLVGGGGRGIDIDGAGTTTISGNTVDNTGVAAIDRSGIQVNATGTLNASVTGNTSQNTTDGGFEVQTNAATATICLRMTGNTTGNGFVLDNRTTGNIPASFRIEGLSAPDFQAANSGTFSYLQTVNAVLFVPAGTCGFAP